MLIHNHLNGYSTFPQCSCYFLFINIIFKAYIIKQTTAITDIAQTWQSGGKKQNRKVQTRFPSNLLAKSRLLSGCCFSFLFTMQLCYERNGGGSHYLVRGWSGGGREARRELRLSQLMSLRFDFEINILQCYFLLTNPKHCHRLFFFFLFCVCKTSA